MVTYMVYGGIGNPKNIGDVDLHMYAYDADGNRISSCQFGLIKGARTDRFPNVNQHVPENAASLGFEVSDLESSGTAILEYDLPNA